MYTCTRETEGETGDRGLDSTLSAGEYTATINVPVVYMVRYKGGQIHNKGHFRGAPLLKWPELWICIPQNH